MFWTQEADAALRARVGVIPSYAVIAGELSKLFGHHITRNAALGRARRIGLSSGPRVRIDRPPREYKPRPAVYFRKRATVANARGHRPQTELPDLPPPADDPLIVPIEQRRSILDLGADDCRWPFGDPGSVEFYLCGGRVREGDSYCQHHCRMAYRPPGRREEQAA